jgi:hypothetical protein
LRSISRLTVLGARRSNRAIDLTDWPAVTPREISSRSVNARERGDRDRGCGRMPPDLNNMPLTDPCWRSNSSAIVCSDSPSRQRSHINAFCVSL